MSFSLAACTHALYASLMACSSDSAAFEIGLATIAVARQITARLKIAARIDSSCRHIGEAAIVLDRLQWVRSRDSSANTVKGRPQEQPLELSAQCGVSPVWLLDAVRGRRSPSHCSWPEAAKSARQFQT